MTKAAVAQQVRGLEQEIGAPLVERSGRGLALTEAGAAGAPGLSRGFRRSGAGGAGYARSPRGAASWSSIRARRSPRPGSSDGSGGSRRAIPRSTCCSTPIRPTTRSNSSTTDALIRWGAGDFPGLATTLLFKEDEFPVCSPDLVSGDHPLRSPEDLKRHTLLHLEGSRAYPSWPAWSDWLKAAGARDVDARHGVWFNNMAMAMRAAAQGQGVALSSFAIAADEIAAGRLVAPFSMSVRTPFGYYFLCRPEEAGTPRIKALREFLVEEAALSAAEPA